VNRVDRAALAGGVAPLEHHHDPRTGLLHPALELHQFQLQRGEFGLVVLLVHPAVVGIAVGQDVALLALGNRLAHRLWRLLLVETADRAVKGKVHRVTSRVAAPSIAIARRCAIAQLLAFAPAAVLYRGGQDRGCGDAQGADRAGGGRERPAADGDRGAVPAGKRGPRADDRGPDGRDLCRFGAGYVFKASYDKANRSSLAGRRGSAWARGWRFWRA
jgi:hypothetical protein